MDKLTVDSELPFDNELFRAVSLTKLSFLVESLPLLEFGGLDPELMLEKGLVVETRWSQSLAAKACYH